MRSAAGLPWAPMLSEVGGAASRPRHELTAAVGADVLHALGAGGAERALVAADAGGVPVAERGAAPLADGSHLQGHRRTIPSTRHAARRPSLRHRHAAHARHAYGDGR